MEVAVLSSNSPYGLCGRKATKLKLNRRTVTLTLWLTLQPVSPRDWTDAAGHVENTSCWPATTNLC